MGMEWGDGGVRGVGGLGVRSGGLGVGGLGVKGGGLGGWGLEVGRVGGLLNS